MSSPKPKKLVSETTTPRKVISSTTTLISSAEEFLSGYKTTQKPSEQEKEQTNDESSSIRSVDYFGLSSDPVVPKGTGSNLEKEKEKSKEKPSIKSNTQALKNVKNLADLLPEEVLKETEPVRSKDWDYEPIRRFEFGEIKFTRYLITELDKEYRENGSYPSFKELVNWGKQYYLTVGYPSDREEWGFILDELATPLVARGLPIYTDGPTDTSAIDPEFVLISNLLCDVTDKRSKAAKLQEVGLTSIQYAAMMRRRANREYLVKRLDKVFDEDVAISAKLAIARGIEVDDLASVKYYHEFTGKYRPQEHTAQSGNNNELFGMFLQAIMQALARHVTSEVISQVAAEIREAPAISMVLGAIEAEAS
jgi:hypothetical protein